jgi:DNA-binding NarL/FixJ family response regulator
MSKIRVVIADDHPIFGRGLRQILLGDPTFELVAEAQVFVLCAFAENEKEPDAISTRRTNCLRQQGIESLSRFPPGKPGRERSPHAAPTFSRVFVLQMAATGSKQISNGWPPRRP